MLTNPWEYIDTRKGAPADVRFADCGDLNLQPAIAQLEVDQSGVYFLSILMEDSLMSFL